MLGNWIWQGNNKTMLILRKRDTTNSSNPLQIKRATKKTVQRTELHESPKILAPGEGKDGV